MQSVTHHGNKTKNDQKLRNFNLCYFSHFSPEFKHYFIVQVTVEETVCEDNINTTLTESINTLCLKNRPLKQDGITSSK